MRHYRQNPDEARRRLERAASGGDVDARAELFILDLRMGKRPELIAAELLLSLEVRELQTVLPYKILDELTGDMILARITGLSGPERGGWFPSHRLQNVCPRGHTIQEAGGFDYMEVRLSFDRCREATEDVLNCDGDRDESDNDEASWVQCRQCGANWPVTEVNYE